MNASSRALSWTLLPPARMAAGVRGGAGLSAARGPAGGLEDGPARPVPAGRGPLQDGVPLTRVATDADVPLRTAQRWLARYRRDALAGLAHPVRRDAGGRRSPSMRAQGSPVSAEARSTSASPMSRMFAAMVSRKRARSSRPGRAVGMEGILGQVARALHLSWPRKGGLGRLAHRRVDGTKGPLSASYPLRPDQNVTRDTHASAPARECVPADGLRSYLR